MDTAMIDARGIGIAAPQVGVLKNVICWGLDENTFGHLVNPVMFGFSGDEQKEAEGCLSLPGLSVEVLRPVSIKVRGWTLGKGEVELEVDGLLARCIQHEMDHLSGVTLVSNLSKLKRDLWRSKLTKQKKKYGYR